VLEARISEGHARVLLSLPTEGAQLRLLGLILERQLSVRQTEDAARRRLSQNGSAVREADEVERSLQALLGTKVSLIRGKKGGRMTIYFYSDEELDALVGRLR